MPESEKNHEIIQEIIRQAELFQQAQLTTALAADQRATGFASLIAAGATVLVAGGAATILAADGYDALGWVALAMAGGLLVSMSLAIWAARPVQIYLPGASPEVWIGDISASKTQQQSLTEMAGNYRDEIRYNQELLAANGRVIARAYWIAWGTLVSGAIAAIGLLVAR